MSSSKNWQPEAVILLIAGVIGCMFLGAILIGSLEALGVRAFKDPDSLAVIVLGTLSFHGAAWVGAGIFLRQHHVSWGDALGWNRERLGKSLLLGVGVLALVLPVVLALQQASVLVLERLHWVAEDQRAVDLIVKSKSWWLKGYLAGFAVVIAPVAEEFIFRGVLYPLCKQLGWHKTAWFGVSAGFALMHLNLPTLIPLWVLALAFTWLYARTGCLLVPILAHSLFNLTNLIILFCHHG
jgi:membrane protease YdiL (CAAX protease family)